MKMLVKKFSHSLKTSGRIFWKLLADVLCKMGFAPARHDNNLLIKLREDGHDCTAAHVHDFMVIEKDGASSIKKINLWSQSRSRNTLLPWL